MNLVREETLSSTLKNTIDIEVLTNPISGNSEAGTDIRLDTSHSSIFYKIKDARNQARTIERQQSQGITNASAKEEWLKVISSAKEILANQSKDLEVCVWLIEALLRQYGFAGLRDGFLLTHSLCKKYWNTLFPQDDQDPFYKIAAFSGLNGEDGDGALITPIYSVPLTQGTSVGPFCQWHYRQALELNLITDETKQAKRIQQGAVTLKEIESAAAQTSVAFFRNLHAELISCQDAYNLLSNFFDKYCGYHAPPSSRIKNALAQCLDTLIFLAGDILNNSELSLDTNTPQNASASDHTKSMMNPNISNLSREKAFEVLTSIANYFRQTEPHSPLSYLIQKTVQWGKLPLPELLNELIKDENVRQQLFTLTGIEAVKK